MNTVTIVAHTPVGTFRSNPTGPLTADEFATLLQDVKDAASTGGHVALETKAGVVVLGKDVVRNSVFKVLR